MGTRSTNGPERIQDDIRKTNFAPVYYVHGEDDFLIEESVEQLIGAAMAGAERGFNVDVLDGGETDPRAIVTLASTFPMMADRRVVVVNSADKIVDPKPLALYLKNPSLTTVLVLTATKPDKRRSSHKLLETEACSIEFPRLYRNHIPSWIETRARKQGFSIDSDGSAMLAEFVGTDLREVQNELEKLYSYAGGRKTLTTGDIQAVSGMTRELSLYELHHAMGARNAKKTMEILDRLLDSGQAAIKIAVSVGFFFISARKLWDIRKHGGSDGDLRLPPSALRDVQAAVAKYSEDQIEDALVSISFADEQLKSTSFPHKQVLQFMAASILDGSGNSFAA